MRASLIVGKVVASVEQRRVPGSRPALWTIDAIHFTDGTCIRLYGHDCEDEGRVGAVYPGRVK
jgi:hypothetical protein